MGDWQNFDNRAVIGRALRLRREIDDFEARWPEPAAREEALPNFTWAQLERQLVDLAATPAQANMARHLVSGTRKLAPFKPSEMVLREILCMTWVLLDENFKTEAEAEVWLERNYLSPAARLGAIVGIAVMTALAFGGMLAGLHALSDIGRTFFRT